MTIDQSRAMASAKTEQAFYAWLSAENKAAADSHYVVFCQGFSHTLEASIRKRYPGVAQELINQATAETRCKMLELFGEPRRKAIATVAAVLASLQPLALGDLHCRRVRAWKGRVAQYRLDVLDFAPAESIRGPIRRERIDAFNAERGTLVDGGHGLVNEVRMQVGDQDAAADDVQKVVARFIATLREWLDSQDAASIDRKLGLDGAAAFVMSMDDLLLALRQLRVLTMAYAFTVCMNELKKLFRSDGRHSNASQAGDASRTPDETHINDPGGEDEQPDAPVSGNISDEFAAPAGDLDGQDIGGAGASMVNASDAPDRGPWGPSASSEDAAARRDIDTIADRAPGPDKAASDQELYRLLLSALEEPYRAAQQRLAAAESKRERDRARIEVDRAARDHELDLGLIVGWVDGDTQEEMATRLGITRNQVRYGLVRMAKRIIQFCEVRHIEYSDELRAMAEGQTLRLARAVSTMGALRPSFNVIDGGRSNTGGEP